MTRGRMRDQNGRVVISRVWRTDTMGERMVGLLRHDGLEADQGLLITACSSIHTFFMRFAIDALFLDQQGRVVAVREHLPPFRLAGCRRARSVLELRAGESRRLGLTALQFLFWEAVS